LHINVKAIKQTIKYFIRTEKWTLKVRKLEETAFYVNIYKYYSGVKSEISIDE